MGHSYFQALKDICPGGSGTLKGVRHLAVLAFLGLALAQPLATPGWVRLVPPVVKDTAAYLTLENRGQVSLRLVGAETPVAQRVSLHQEHREHRGGHTVLGMRPLPYLDLSPGVRVVFQPGGYHFMLEGLKRPLKAGEKVELVLKFADGTRLRVVLPVEMR